MKRFLWLPLLMLFTSAAQCAPVLLLQDENTSQYFFGIVSNGGRWIVEDKQIFDGRTGLRWGELPFSPVCFTPDAAQILMAEQVKPPVDPDYWRVALCEMPSGRKLRWFNKAVYPLWCDNTRFCGVENGTIVELDLRTGRKKSVKIQDPPNEGDQPEYAFSENAKFLIEGKSGVIRWWNTASGQLLGRIKDEDRSDNATGISNDGRWLATQSEIKGYVGSGIHYTLNGAPFKMYLWDARTRKMKYSFKDFGFADFRFAPDGRSLLSNNDGSLHRFDIRTGKDKQAFSGKKFSGKDYLYAKSLSQDWQWMIGIGNEGIPEVWFIPEEKHVSSFIGSLLKVDKVKWSPDSKYLAGITADHSMLLLWNAHTGKLVSHLNTSINDFSWTNVSTLRSQTPGSMQLWSLPELKPKGEWNFSPPRDDAFRSYFNGLSIAPDGHTILTGDNTLLGAGDELWVWDSATKQVRHKIKIAGTQWTSTEFENLFWLTDSQRILIPMKNGLIVLNTATGKIEREQHDPVEPAYSNEYHPALYPLRMSLDGKWLAVFAARNKKVIVFDLKDWSVDSSSGVAWWQSLNSRSKFPGASHSGELSPDGRLVAFTDRSHAYQPDSDLSFGPSGNFKGISIWSVAKRREVLQLYPVGNEVKSKAPGWIALTPEGYYDASSEGEKHLRWREGNTFWPIAKSRARFRRPDLVRQALKGQ